jgi:hypothetical protein
VQFSKYHMLYLVAIVVHLGPVHVSDWMMISHPRVGNFFREATPNLQNCLGWVVRSVDQPTSCSYTTALFDFHLQLHFPTTLPSHPLLSASPPRDIVL